MSGDPLTALGEALDSREAETPRELPPPTAPMEVARALVHADFTDHAGTLTLRHWRGGWWRWRTSRWVEVEQRAMAAAAYRFTEHAVHPGRRVYRSSGHRTGTRSPTCSMRSRRSCIYGRTSPCPHGWTEPATTG